MKKMLSLVVCLALVFGVVSAVPASAREDKVTVSYTFFADSGATYDLYMSIFDAFNEQSETTQVEFIPIIEDYSTKLLIMVASGSAPDLAWLSDANIKEYADQNAVLDLRQFDGNQLDLSIYDQNLLTAYSYGESVYGIPFDSCSDLMYVNKDMFEAAGLTVPTAPLTWDEIREYAKTLTSVDDNGITTDYGFAMDIGLGNIYAFVRQNGGDIIDAEGKPTFNTPEVIEAYQFVYDMINEDRTMPSGQGEDVIPFYEMFKAGHIGMMWGGGWFCSTVLPEAECNYAVVPLPIKEVQAATAYSGGTCILSSTKNPENAAEFLGWFNGVEGQTMKFSGSFAASPTITELMNTDLAYNGYRDAKHPDVTYEWLVDALNYQFPQPTAIFGNMRVTDEITALQDQFFAGDIDVNMLVEQIDAAIEPLL